MFLMNIALMTLCFILSMLKHVMFFLWQTKWYWNFHSISQNFGALDNVFLNFFFPHEINDTKYCKNSYFPFAL